MSHSRIRWIVTFATLVSAAVLIYAQNPVSISQVGTTPVTTTVPVSGTVTANAGTNLNTSALATEATLSTLNGKVTAVDTGAVVVASGSLIANAGTNLNTSALLTTAAHDAAFGTAGSADAQVRSIQGIASMTPVQVQSNSANVATETSAAAIATSLAIIDDWDASDHAKVNLAQIAGSTVVADPCQVNAKVYTPISQTAGTQLVAGTSAKKTYVCSILIVAADAENVSLIAGTGTVCATNSVAVIGGTTAAAGPNLAANGGFALGNGASAIAATTVNADNLCLLQSASGRVAGTLVTVVQ